MMRVLVLAVLAVAGPFRAEAASEQPSVRVEARAKVSKDAVILDYIVTNLSKEPVLVFDRRWDLEADRLDPSWASVAIEGKTAVVMRRVIEPPPGVLIEQPNLPYGHELAAGAASTGTIRLAFPLTEQAPHDDFGPVRAKTEDVALTAVQFEVGWAPKSSLAKRLDPEDRVLEGGETLWLFEHHGPGKAERLARSPAVQLSAAGRRPAGPRWVLAARARPIDDFRELFSRLDALRAAEAWTPGDVAFALGTWLDFRKESETEYFVVYKATSSAKMGIGDVELRAQRADPKRGLIVIPVGVRVASSEIMARYGKDPFVSGPVAHNPRGLSYFVYDTPGGELRFGLDYQGKPAILKEVVVDRGERLSRP